MLNCYYDSKKEHELKQKYVDNFIKDPVVKNVTYVFA